MLNTNENPTTAYAFYLVFQLWTHASLYGREARDNVVSQRYDASVRAIKAIFTYLRPKKQELEEMDLPNGNAEDGELEGVMKKPEEKPSMSIYMCIGSLIIVTAVS